MENATLPLPHNKEAEEYLLGGILLENSSLEDLSDQISADDFYAERHRIIFSEMLKLSEKGMPIDYITLTEAVENSGHQDKVGGASYIAQLADRIPTSANIEYYARIVRNKAVLRSLINGAGEIIKEARNPVGDITDVIDHAEQTIYTINKEVRDATRGGLQSISPVLLEVYDKLNRISKGEVVQGGIPTGYGDLDAKLMGGLHRTDLVIVAGRPAMGKTSFAMNIAAHVAIREGMPVAVFSLEMGCEQLAMRMLSSEARLDQGKVRQAMLKREEWSALLDASGEISEAPLYIDDTPGISPMEMRAKLRRMASREEIGLVVVDYLQLMSTKGRNDSREQEISEISRSLKGMAKEFNVPVVALSQLNRGVEQRNDKRPMMSDLRESGAIEQDADIITFVYRDEVYNPDTAEKGMAEIIIGKHRNGPTGMVNLAWISECTRFVPLDNARHAPY